MNEELTPTPAAEWPRSVVQTVTLPSGGTARLKRPDTFTLLRENKVPKKVMQVMARKRGGSPITEAEAVALIEFLIAASFVSPQLAFTKSAGALCVRDLSDADKAAVIEILELA